MSTWLRWCALIAIFAGASFLRARDLFVPFDLSPDGARNASYAIAARHLERVGFEEVGLFPVFDPEVDSSTRGVTTAPPLVHWLNAGILRFFGPSLWVLRLHHVLASLGICLAVYALGCRAMGPLGGLVAAALTACLPMLSFAGTRLDHLNLGLALTLLALWAHLRWNELGRLRDALRFTACAMLAACVDWMVLPLIPALALERLLPRGNLSARRRLRAAGFTLLTGGLAVGLALTWHAALLNLDPVVRGEGPWRTSLAPLAETFHVLLRGAEGSEGSGWPLRPPPALLHPEVLALGLLGALTTLLPFRRCERARSMILPGLIASVAAIWIPSAAAIAEFRFAPLVPFLALSIGFLASRTVNLIFRAQRPRLLWSFGTTLALAVLAIGAGETWHATWRRNVDTEELAAPWREVPKEFLVHLPRPLEPHPALSFHADRRLASYDPSSPWTAVPLAALRQIDLAPTAMETFEDVESIALLLPEDARLSDELRHRLTEVVRLERFEPRRGTLFLLVEAPEEQDRASLVRLRAARSAMRRVRKALEERSAKAPQASILYTDPLPDFAGPGPLCANGVWFYFLQEGRLDDFLGAIPAPEHAQDLEFRASQGQGSRAVVVTAEAVETFPGLREHDGVRHRWDGHGSFWTAELPESSLKAPLGGSH